MIQGAVASLASAVLSDQLHVPLPTNVRHSAFGLPSFELSVLRNLINSWKEQHGSKQVARDRAPGELSVQKVEQTIRLLKFTEFGRNMNSDAFMHLFLKEPMLIYHREILDS